MKKNIFSLIAESLPFSRISERKKHRGEFKLVDCCFYVERSSGATLQKESQHAALYAKTKEQARAK